jgi:hypothetical protein
LEKLALGGIRSAAIADTDTKIPDTTPTPTPTASTTTSTNSTSTSTIVSDTEIATAVREYLRFAAAISANDHLTIRTEEER